MTHFSGFYESGFSTNFGEVAKHFGVGEVELGALIVTQDERKHGVLSQIVERSPRNFVQMHQVVKVAERSCETAQNTFE